MSNSNEVKEERRQSLRLHYRNQAIIVDCETMDRYQVKTYNMSPLGMGVSFKEDITNLKGKDVIVVTQTLIMYATIVRVEKKESEYEAGISAKKFTPEVLEYLFESIGGKDRIEE